VRLQECSSTKIPKDLNFTLLIINGQADVIIGTLSVNGSWSGPLHAMSRSKVIGFPDALEITPDQSLGPKIVIVWLSCVNRSSDQVALEGSRRA
jgi:hypothetical protein